MRKLLQLRFTFILVPAIILLLVFLSGFTGKTASADMSGQHTMKSYENVLIKSGDTLSSLADTYAEKYSNLSKAEYEEAIISLTAFLQKIFMPVVICYCLISNRQEIEAFAPF